MRLVRLAALALTLCVLMVSGPASISRGADLIPIKLGVLDTITDIPLIIADRKGFFAAEGLKVEFISFKSSSEMVVPLATGQLDAGGGGAGVGLYNASVRHLDIKIVADKASDPVGYGFESLLVRSDLVKNRRVRTPKDLKGLTMSANQPGGVSYIMLVKLLQKYGLTTDDIQLLNLDFPTHVAALANGKLDATITAEPHATLAVEAGSAVRMMTSDMWYPNEEISVLIYGRNLLNNRDLADRFMRGYLRGARYYYAALKNGHVAGKNADEVCSIINQTTDVKSPKTCRDMIATAINPDGRLNVDSMRRDLEVFREEKLALSGSRIDDVVDQSFLESALKVLGPYKAGSQR